MKRLILIAVLQIIIGLSSVSAFGTSCRVNGKEISIMGTIQLNDKINDTYQGVVATLTTKNINETTISTESGGKYLSASFENDEITLFTTDAFKKFEIENMGGSVKYITVKLDFLCSDGHAEWLTIYQYINDVNSYAPALNEEVYEYSFGMTIPEDFDLTKFLPITASDRDFTTTYMYFKIEGPINEHFRIKYTTMYDSQTKIFSTKLTTLQELKAPFRQEFTISATDDGRPEQLSKSSKVIVTIYENPYAPETNLHPPVFAEHLYFADYFPNSGLKFTETITMKFGGQTDTKITQSAYDNYFKIQAKSSTELKVLELQKLPDNIIKTNDFLVIEIEGENPGLAIKGRTALVIRVHNNGGSEEMIHPPVFEKHLYFADYSTDKGLKMKETIRIKHGLQKDTKVQQSDYSDYLSVHLKDSATGELSLEQKQKFSQSVIQGKDLLVIEINAENPGLTIKGRTALIIRLIDGNDEGHGTGHPPVFEQHVYFADYIPGRKDLSMDETISIKYGFQDSTTVQQSNYEEYFKIQTSSSKNGELEVRREAPLPDSIVDYNDMLMIEIEAHNPELNIPGRTALIIRLNKDNGYYVSNVWTYAFGDGVLPLILGLCGILIIVFINIIVLSLYVWKHKRLVKQETSA